MVSADRKDDVDDSIARDSSSSTGNKGLGANSSWQPSDDGPKIWGLLFFALFGATVTTAAVTQLRRTFDRIFTEFNRNQPFSSWKTGSSSSSYGGFREEARKRYSKRMQEEYEEEMERVERIRRMQSVFNREKNKFKRSYESWGETGPGAYQHYQHFQRDDWYWKSDTSYRGQRANSRSAPRNSGTYAMSHHYSVLGLDRSRERPYSDAEIKAWLKIPVLGYFRPPQKLEIPARIFKILAKFRQDGRNY